jgi:hypothetical protein
MSYEITVDGTDRTECFINRTITIQTIAGSQPAQMWANFVDKDELGEPGVDEEIVVTEDGSKLFGGYIINSHLKKEGEVFYSIQATDYTRGLDRQLVVESYQDKTDKFIIEDIVGRYCQGEGISTTNVTEDVTFSKINFNYLQPSECFRKICQLTGRSWYLDFDKDLHYFASDNEVAPFNITEAENRYSGLNIKKTNTNIRNRVYVRGGTFLSDTVTIKQVADGEQTVFYLPHKPHDITVTEGVNSKTVGIKNIDSLDDYDYLVSYQEKYVETDAAPAASTVMTFTFKYDVPILVAVEDKDSIEDNGMFEYLITDNEIETEDDARDRAKAELTDYAETIIDGEFTTRTDGFRAGQYLTVNLSEYGINDDYLIRRVTAKSQGGGTFEYRVALASAESVGIIKFLIKLLEADKNMIAVDPDEVVDELFEPDEQGIGVAESLESADLATPDARWGSFKWNLEQWK